MHTGDVGVLDADGYLRIVDRIKELIINAAGKNMSPAQHRDDRQGRERADRQRLLHRRWPPVQHRTDHTRSRRSRRPRRIGRRSRVREAVAAAVERANERLARVEQIKRFTLLGSDWTPGGAELTPTMKLKRKPIAAIYATEIEAMY